MAERIRVGDRLPFFLYDTPYSAGNRFRDLLDEQAPLVLVFMANFGHPITRTFASRYADTYTSLHDGARTSWPAASARTRCPIPCCATRRAFCMST